MVRPISVLLQQVSRKTPSPGLQQFTLKQFPKSRKIALPPETQRWPATLLVEFAAEARYALELQSFQVAQPRQGKENPPFDIRTGKAHYEVVSVFGQLANPSGGFHAARYFSSIALPAAL